MSKFSRRLIAVAAAAVMAVASVPAQANAQQVPLPDLSSNMPALPNNLPALPSNQAELSSALGLPTPEQAREGGWQTRNELHRQIDTLPQGAHTKILKDAVDHGVEFFHPGLVGQKNAEAHRRAEEQRRQAEAARVAEQQRQQQAQLGPCPPAAEACIDVIGQRAWLQKDGVLTYGPVPVSTGANGWDTPEGWHKVNRKVKDEVSYEFNMAPMPYSVYFTYNGIAFHQGDPKLLSHGCVHVPPGDAKVFYDSLDIGDDVYVWGDLDRGVPNGRL
ncbi:L,D-transpeptidase [Corynebacterium pilosum]|uniref:Putative secreted protein n=1 Tax=Corynebacterium pilosum TaxID=35756 RepID=A0A376CN12_9CORY|nr:L,D-transpeptidase [Corynebacterium pilosum]STC69652.1 putative secreted protein [Corynebacterium pilosum]